MRSLRQSRGIGMALVSALVSVGLLGATVGFTAEGRPIHFTVRIQNISSGNVLKLSSGGDAPFALSPGLWLVHTKDAPVFKSGEKDRGQGLEALAEDGNPMMLTMWLEHQKRAKSLGIFNTPVGASGPGPIGPGGVYEFMLTATPGTRMTIVTMFGQSNDLFYAPKASGIALFDKQGKPIRGDITRHFVLWDAGTEVNQEPGAGPDQAPRQKAPNTGADENGVVRPVQDQYTYPQTRDVLRVTITPHTGTPQM